MRKVKGLWLLFLIFLISCGKSEQMSLVKLKVLEEATVDYEEESIPEYLTKVSTEAEPSFSKMTNSINDGYVVEDDNKIIYSDKNGIYIIDTHVGIYEKLSNVSGKFLSLYKDDLYYYDERQEYLGIYKINLGSKENEKILDRYTDGFVIYGDFLYVRMYEDISENIEKRYVAKMDLNGEIVDEVFSYQQNIEAEDVLPLYFYISEGWLYYVERDTYLYLNKIDLQTKRKELVASTTLDDFTLDDFIVDNDYIYFTKKSIDEKSPLFLYRYNTLKEETEAVVSNKIWSYSVDDKYIYYVDASKDYNLFRRKKWSSGTVKLSDRSLNHINVINNLIYVEDNYNSANHFWFTKNGRELNLGFGKNYDFFDYSVFFKTDV